jgi:hypothetical protein
VCDVTIISLPLALCPGDGLFSFAAGCIYEVSMLGWPYEFPFVPSNRSQSLIVTHYCPNPPLPVPHLNRRVVGGGAARNIKIQCQMIEMDR